MSDYDDGPDWEQDLRLARVPAVSARDQAADEFYGLREQAQRELDEAETPSEEERAQQRVDELRRAEEARVAEIDEERARENERRHLAALQLSDEGIEFARDNGLVELRGKILLNTARERGYQAARKAADKWPMYLRR